MKNSTRKKKGDGFEKFIVNEIRKYLDPKAKQTKASGAGLDKGDIYCPGVDWLIEAKNHKHLVITDWIEQTKAQDNDAVTSMCVFKHAKSADVNPEPYVVISLYDLISLYKKNSVIVNEETKDNKELIWALQSLKSNINKVIKLTNESQ